MFFKWARSCENVSYAICEQQRCRLACASAQSGQHLCCSLLSCMICILAISKVSRFWLASVAEQAGLNLIGSKIPEDTFSHDVAQIVSVAIKCAAIYCFWVIWTFQWFFFSFSRLIYESYPCVLRQCFVPNMCDQVDWLSVVHNFTLSMGSSIKPVKVCAKRSKVRNSKPCASTSYEKVLNLKLLFERFVNQWCLINDQEINCAY